MVQQNDLVDWCLSGAKNDEFTLHVLWKSASVCRKCSVSIKISMKKHSLLRRCRVALRCTSGQKQCVLLCFIKPILGNRGCQRHKNERGSQEKSKIYGKLGHSSTIQKRGTRATVGRNCDRNLTFYSHHCMVVSKHHRWCDRYWLLLCHYPHTFWWGSPCIGVHCKISVYSGRRSYLIFHLDSNKQHFFSLLR